jgi:hypothetical protein
MNKLRGELEAVIKHKDGQRFASQAQTNRYDALQLAADDAKIRSLKAHGSGERRLSDYS